MTKVARYAAMMTDPDREALLQTSTDYIRAKRAFTTAIRDARSAGMDDEEIAHVIGLTVDKIRRAAMS